MAVYSFSRRLLRRIDSQVHSHVNSTGACSCRAAEKAALKVSEIPTFDSLFRKTESSNFEGLFQTCLFINRGDDSLELKRMKFRHFSTIFEGIYKLPQFAFEGFFLGRQ